MTDFGKVPGCTVYPNQVLFFNQKKMKIKFNEKENTVEIKDGLKQQYFLTKMSLIFTLINSVIFPVFVLDEKQLRWMGFIWIILGIISTGAFIYHLQRKTASEKVNLSDINSLTEKQLLGRKSLSLKLKNGKLRDLPITKKESDISEIKKLFENLGISTA